ncbi:hypothetical protein HYZ98_00210 [Candidatus Peregrinibacteria bacterium]|nr:hypothetical protein [Candidatus Peregrinibacteria bacterium]
MQSLLPQGSEDQNEMLSRIFQEKNEDTVRKCRDILGKVPLDAYEVRVWCYRLLMSHPEITMSEEEYADAVRVSKHILRNPKGVSLSSLLATHVVNQSFLYGEDPNPDKEHNEFFGLKRAREELQSSDSTDSDHRHALMVLAWYGETTEEKSAALQEFIDKGDEWGIAHGCLGMDTSFHIQTKCAYLEDAIRAVQNKEYLAQLFIRKMGIMLEILPVFIEQQDTENANRTIGQIQQCHANLQLQECSPWWRVFDQYHMAKLSDILGEPRLAKFLAVTASVLAKQLEIIYLQKQTQDLINELMEGEGE